MFLTYSNIMIDFILLQLNQINIYFKLNFIILFNIKIIYKFFFKILLNKSKFLIKNLINYNKKKINFKIKLILNINKLKMVKKYARDPANPKKGDKIKN